MSRVEQLRSLLTTANLRHAEIQPQQSPPLWNRDNLSGRLTEISSDGASATLTTAIGLVLDTQRQGDPVVWITLPSSIFYPPDVDDSGVDLDALAVVRAPLASAAARAADRLVRSGAFGLIILDLGKDAYLPNAMQGRLVGLAQKHDTAIVCLTEKSSDTPSLGSMVSLRVTTLREKLTPDIPAGGFRCKLEVVKDKRRGPNWKHSETVRGPSGLR
jgi:recombination protein RecA